MAHFTLYVLKGLWGPNPIKVAALLESLNLDYDVKALEFGSSDKATGVKGEDYLAICVNGRTPTLIDHKRNDFTVWESGAILEYILDVYDTEHKFSGKTPEEKALISQWLFFQVTGHSPVQGNLYFSNVYWKNAYQEEVPPTVIKRFSTELDRVYKVYEKQLSAQFAKYGEDKAWLVLDRPTAADFSAMGWLGLLPDIKDKLGVNTEQYPVLMKYVEKLRAQEGLAKVFAKLQH
ncbi:hypothetical protein ACI68E_002673 [Malassezia pachydermatis]|uniref:Glutathione s-transferase family protein n=1 Tax=Malassezia pachydermatis TaxID=77020 RepID=A0A0M9VQU9_9BASI|nr:glutathione s-transferase family protein [Malassezia pachydermatis]KOS15902.1 glutathione s-transferase family protein [Malassezia pachydermatis]